ncbi:MAG: glycerol kinase GlpK [Acidimicrobiia bacterium]|nr:glycerol kinase GlpK [Acidimicrobiia bacterium]
MKYIGALDQGTTSTRFILFDQEGEIVASAQKEHEQIFPRAGWVEHDPDEILLRVGEVIAETMAKAAARPADVAGVGITNQRETTMLWDRASGRPIGNAVVWQDVRTADLCGRLGTDFGQDRFRAKTGLPLATYFAGPKIAWLLDNTPGLRARAEAGEIAFGTMDSWVVWNLTGGPGGGLHITDVTNASRTLLMDLATLEWDAGLLAAVGVPEEVLPEIRSSVEVYGEAKGTLAGVPIAGILGDQQAALFGQTCFAPGEAKNTYGTGCFMLMNTGLDAVPSKAGLLTTVAYQVDGQPPHYALEGSIAMAGALVQWLRDNLGIIDTAEAIEALAGTVADNGGVFIVPAFNGLFAPYWRDDARGVIVGLTRYANKGHIARATLEAVAFQTKEVLDAMYIDSGVALAALKVDGGMVANQLLMQFQADLLDVPVVRPAVAETTALGAAYAAGLAVGFWPGFDALRDNWSIAQRWEPNMDAALRRSEYAKWKKAVTRSFDWV